MGPGEADSGSPEVIVLPAILWLRDGIGHEVYLESCLAVAEHRLNDEIGLHTSLFEALLADAVARDRKRGAKSYGQMGNTAEEKLSYPRFRRGYTSGTYSVTYRGERV